MVGLMDGGGEVKCMDLYQAGTEVGEVSQQ